MITLALDTATDRCTVAASDGQRVAHAHLDGSRRHAAAVIGMIDNVLGELGVTSATIARVVTADGPGSFTGLRVAASIAKALTWHRPVEWLVASSLLVRAAAHAPPNGGTVLALSDALRGELYAGCWRISAVEIALHGPVPRGVMPASLRGYGAVDVVVGTIPVALIADVRAYTERDPIIGEAALPDARTLLRLATIPGGTAPVADPRSWQPEYGRPVEAQAVWERNHGMELPTATSIAR